MWNVWQVIVDGKPIHAAVNGLVDVKTTKTSESNKRYCFVSGMKS